MVVYFCKGCNNLLMLEVENNQCTLYCVTCPYRRPLEYHVRVAWTRDNQPPKPEDYFYDMEKARKLLPTTTETCPQCSHLKAYYYEAQTRSADEATTIFYRCANKECNHSWKDN